MNCKRHGYTEDYRVWRGYKVCRQCNRDSSKRSYQRHKEGRLEWFRQRYRKNTAHVAAINRRWRVANPEKRREYERRYESDNKERIRLRRMRYLEAHPESRDRRRQKALERYWKDPQAALSKCHMRRASLRGNIVTSSEWRRKLEEFGRCCAYCGNDRLALTQDHVVPLSRGGLHHIDNIVPACQPCNSRKGNRMVAA